MPSLKTAAKATVAALALAMSLSAANVSITLVSGTWTSTTSSPGDFPCVAGIGTSSVSWGHNLDPIGCDLAPADQSGFVFVSNIPPQQDFVVPPDTGLFPLGTFIHRNNPVNDPVETADLKLDVDLLINGSPFSTSFTYTFDLNETPNNPVGPCPTGGTPTGSGGVGCNDVVSIVTNPAPIVFNAGGTLVTLTLQFSQDGGATPSSQFITTENQDNLAVLYGQITATSDVPEPMTFVMAGGALLGLGLVRRYRQ